MLHTYHYALKEHFFKAEKLKKHALLKSTKWTKAGYELLSDLIGNDLSQSLTIDEQRRMGTSISARTLQSFFDGTYKLSYPLDPRTLNTLNKMVRFVGGTCWDSFVDEVDALQAKTQETVSDDALVLAVVQKHVEAEFKVYATLPKIDFSFLDKICLEKSGAWLRVHDDVLSHKNQNHCLSNAYNPSTVEVLEAEVVRLEANYAQVKTKEYWLMCWWCLDKERYVQRFKDINEHFYILTKTTEGWRVKGNASLAEFNGEWQADTTLPTEAIATEVHKLTEKQGQKTKKQGKQESVFQI